MDDVPLFENLASCFIFHLNIIKLATLASCEETSIRGDMKKSTRVDNAWTIIKGDVKNIIFFNEINIFVHVSHDSGGLLIMPLCGVKLVCHEVAYLLVILEKSMLWLSVTWLGSSTRLTSTFISSVPILYQPYFADLRVPWNFSNAPSCYVLLQLYQPSNKEKLVTMCFHLNHGLKFCPWYIGVGISTNMFEKRWIDVYTDYIDRFLI